MIQRSEVGPPGVGSREIQLGFGWSDPALRRRRAGV